MTRNHLFLVEHVKEWVMTLQAKISNSWYQADKNRASIFSPGKKLVSLTWQVFINVIIHIINTHRTWMLRNLTMTWQWKYAFYNFIKNVSHSRFWNLSCHGNRFVQITQIRLLQGGWNYGNEGFFGLFTLKRTQHFYSTGSCFFLFLVLCEPLSHSSLLSLYLLLSGTIRFLLFHYLPSFLVPSCPLISWDLGNWSSS